MSLFDRPDALFDLLINERGQLSVWPSELVAPDGWDAVARSVSFETCEGWLRRDWRDLRPTTTSEGGR